MQISILIPIFNESENIPLLYSSLLSTLNNQNYEFEIILVNDGSTDNSMQVLNQIALEDNRIKVIHFRRNYGQTAALMAAINHSKGEVLIPMDGDLQNDPKDIPQLLVILGQGFDVVSGWRKNRQDKNLTRKFPSKIANWVISGITGVKLHDYGCTLKAYRRSILENVKLYGEMHRFIPIYAAWEGGKITEMVVNHHPRRLGVSKYGIGRVPKVILDLILIRFMHIAFDRPMQFFGKIGAYCIGVSFFTGIWSFWLKIFQAVSFISTPLPLLCAFFGLTGVICILLGLLAELQMRIYFESQSKNYYSIKSTTNFKTSL
jgi:dolichol-phosphate mannosyltransferase